MSGIVGALDLTGNRDFPAEWLRAMTVAIAHRGPDDEYFHREPGLALGTRGSGPAPTDPAPPDPAPPRDLAQQCVGVAPGDGAEGPLSRDGRQGPCPRGRGSHPPRNPDQPVSRVKS